MIYRRLCFVVRHDFFKFCLLTFIAAEDGGGLTLAFDTEALERCSVTVKNTTITNNLGPVHGFPPSTSLLNVALHKLHQGISASE